MEDLVYVAIGVAIYLAFVRWVSSFDERALDRRR